jgi:ABC-type sugar transport system substrate-binding protein
VFVSGVDVIRGPQAPPRKLVIVMGGSGPYWQLAAAGAREAAAEHGLDLSIQMPRHDGDVQEQTALLERLTATELQGVACCPVDGAGQASMVEKLAKQGKLVLFGKPLASDARTAFYLGSCPFSTGRRAAAAAIEAMPSGGTVLALADATNDAHKERLEGFRETIGMKSAERPGTTAEVHYDVIEIFEHGSVSSVEAQVREAILEHPDVACIVRLSEGSVAGLTQLLCELNQSGQTKLISCDERAETLDAVRSGEVYAVVADDPFEIGRMAATWLNQLCKSDTLGLPVAGCGKAHVCSKVVRRDNVDEFFAKLSSPAAMPAG